MSRRLSVIPPALLLGVCLVILPACKKKPSEDGGGGGDVPAPGPSGPPAAVSSDYLLFAQVNAKSIRESSLFTEVKQAVVKAGGTKEWDDADTNSAAEIGVKWTQIDAATVVITEAPMKGEPKMVAIISANKAFDKSAVLKKGGKTAADPNGFYKLGPDMLCHFPDDKTLVVVSPDLSQKYLAGYAKNRSGWPMTADLTRAASGHTVFAAVNVQKAPREALAAAGDQFSALAATQKVVVTADLRGKELSLGVRASYADAATATKAKEQAQATLDMAAGFVGMAASNKEMAALVSFKPAVQEAQRALKAAKIEASGSDLTLAAGYKADFDIGQMVTDAVKKVRESAGRMTASNNLKQIGLGLHNYASVNQDKIPVHGIGANGAALKNATEKPLLSWRVAILPYIEQGELYKQFKLNEPWDSENNKKLIAKMPKLYAPVTKEGKPGYTHLQMVIGPGGMTPGQYTIGNIPDGTSNTIAVIEAADPVIWTKPDDVMLPAKLAPGDLKKKFGGQFPNGFNVLMWDASIRSVSGTISENNLRLAICPDDGQVLPNDWDEK